MPDFSPRRTLSRPRSQQASIARGIHWSRLLFKSQPAHSWCSKHLRSETCFNRMNRLPIFIFVWVALTALGFAREPVRLAISGDPAFANEADLIAVELSKVPDAILLERQQILKIAEEHALQLHTSADGIKLGQLLGADGLLILSPTEADGRKLIAARLVAVHLGVVIDEWTSLPYEAADGRIMAVAFSQRITPLLQKLRVDKKDAIPVSVAGLFAAVDSPELRAVERELTWLLIHRLTKEPSVFVLERRRMEDLVWEKNLGNAEAMPFLSGAVIVEGKLEVRDGKLDLALGLRRPGEKKAKPSSVTGVSNDLPAFVEKIAASILEGLKIKSAEQRWNLAEEAAIYADQAEWAMNHRMLDLCIASAESAWALGRRDVDLARLRVMAYSLKVTPYWPDILGDALYRGGLNVGYGEDWKLDGKDLENDLAASIRALEISAECLSVKLPPSRIAGREFRPVAAQALGFTSSLIKKHYLSGKYQAHAEQVNYLRSLAIDVCSKLSKSPELRPSYYNIRYRHDSLTLQAMATYAPYWFDNNEDVMACFHRLFKSVHFGEDRDDAMMDPYSLENGFRLSPRLVPWVVAWKPAENRQRQLDMITRLKRLTESPGFDDQLVGWASLRWLVKQAEKAKITENDIRWPQEYAAALAGKPTNASPHDIVSKGAQEFLWNFREQLAVCHKTAASSILFHVPSEADRDYRLRYIRYIFESGHLNHWVSLRLLLENLDLTEGECVEFLKSCTTAREKTKAREDFEYKEHFFIGLNEAEEILSKGNPRPTLKPETMPKPKPSPALVQSPSIPPIIVTRYWYPNVSADAPKMRSGFQLNGVSYADGKLWFVKDGNGTPDYLGSVALDSFHTEYRPLPLPGMWPWRGSPFITKDAVYLLNIKGNKKWDRNNDRWSSLALPSYPYSGRILGNSLYLSYEFGSELRGIDLHRRSSAGSGMLRLDLSNNSATFLASSRRRPAETILDAREPYIPLALFSGAGGALSAALEFPGSGERKIFRTTAAGDWEKVMDLPNTQIGQVHFQYVKDGILAFMHPKGSPHAFFQSVFFGADGGPREVLLSHSKPSDPPGAILPGASRWDLQGETNPRFSMNTAFDYCDGRLYQIKMLEHLFEEDYEQNAQAPTPEVILAVYMPGSRVPVTIPLRFQLSEADKTQINADNPSISRNGPLLAGPLAESRAVKNVERVSEMKVVPEGIIFYGGKRIGFWLLPAKELEERIVQIIGSDAEYKRGTLDHPVTSQPVMKFSKP